MFSLASLTASSLVLVSVLPAHGRLAAGSSPHDLLPNGDFEQGLVPTCHVQGLLPPPWFQGGLAVQGADVYTFNCSQLNGLAPTDFNNFPTLLSAQSGLRFAAGWGQANEVLGTPLLAAPRADVLYELSGYFTLSVPHSGLEPYQVYLSVDDRYDPAGANADLLVGTIGAGSAVGVWSFDRLLFVLPSNAPAFTHLFLDPEASGDCYIGMDSLVLRPFHARRL